jgi:hypothetical protein
MLILGSGRPVFGSNSLLMNTMFKWPHTKKNPPILFRTISYLIEPIIRVIH